MELTDICVICNHELDFADVVNVTSDDLDILIEFSKACGDGLWKNWNKDVPVVLHSDCKENYIRDTREIAEYVRMRGVIDDDEFNKPRCEWACYAKKRKTKIPELSDEEHEKIKKSVMEMCPDSMLATILRLEEQHSKKKHP